MADITAEQVARAIKCVEHAAGEPELVAALTRWRDELVAAERPDDTAPERLRERRAALGWTREDVAVSSGIPLWYGIGLVEEYTGHDDVRARYAAALIAAEAERARPAIDPLAYTDSPAWDEPPVRKPAPEVVDVPQPIVKRCACPDIHDDVEAEWRPGEPYLTVTHTTIPLALLRAMLEAIDAQQGGAS